MQHVLPITRELLYLNTKLHGSGDVPVQLVDLVIPHLRHVRYVEYLTVTTMQQTWNQESSSSGKSSFDFASIGSSADNVEYFNLWLARYQCT